MFACTPAPRYHYSPKHPPKPARTKGPSGQRQARPKPPPLLIKGVQHTAVFTASFYGLNDGFDGKKAANGEIFDKDALTAAHKSLPFGTILKVTFPKTGKSVNVRINDRGPYVPGRDIDLSYGAALKLGLVKYGVGKVKVTVIKWGTGETSHHE
jgi:rare lipoprotein A